MIVYIDSSVAVRAILGEPGILAWDDWERAYSSTLLLIEVGRALQRVSPGGGDLPGAEARRAAAFAEFRNLIGIIPLSEDIARVAAGPFPLPVKALDAIHVATALSVAKDEPLLVFATHDRQQGAAAEAMGLAVVGV